MKYRIWSRTIKQWITHTAVVTGDGSFLSLSVTFVDGDKKDHRWNVVDLSSIDPIVEIFTGLIDKNGKGIYVGDILDNGNKHTGSRSQVMWQDNAAACRAIVGSGESGLFNLVHTGYMCEGKSTIVGNIHENPELLTNE